MHQRFAIKRFSFGVLASALVLSGCGGGGGSSTPVTPVVAATSQSQQAQFKIPQALRQAVPHAPPNFIPAPPTAAQRAAMKATIRDFVSGKSGGRKRADAMRNQVVRFDTSLGNIDVLLRSDAAPDNVANFLSYVNNNSYAGSFIHRSIPNVLFQGGGYTASSGPSGLTFNTIPTQAAVANEFDLSNTRGTLAMAKTSNDPNSATSQWFFNDIDNSSTLDSQDGGYTVIGTVETSDGLAVMDAIAQTAVPNPGPLPTPFDMAPLTNYTTGTAVQESNLVSVSNITEQPEPAFFNGEVYLGNGTYSLTFADGTPFGYYTYLSDPNYLYHYDLGYEYVFDAQDGQDGVYLYDFASETFFYTSPSFPFPYLYDFSRNAVLYYFPDTSNPGHYTSNPRYFYDFSAGMIITK